MDESIFAWGHPRGIHPSPGLCPAGGGGLSPFSRGTSVLEASGPRVAPALFGQRGAGTRTLTVHSGEEKQDQRRPPPRRLFCAPATGHNHGRWRERGGDGGGGGAGARRRRHRAPGCSLRAPRRREGEGRPPPPPPPARPPALPPSGPPSAARQLPLRAAREPYAGRPSRRQGQVER